MDSEATKWVFAGIGFVGGSFSAYIAQSVVKSIKFKKDSEAVYRFLKKGIKQHQYRTTKAIAADTNLTPARVEEICNKHRLIRPSMGKPDGHWTLR